MGGVASSCASKSGVIVGSAKQVRRTYSTAALSHLKVSNAIKTVIIQGNTPSMVVEAPENLLPYLQIKQEGSSCSVGMDRRYVYMNVNITVTIQTPYLAHLELSGGAKARFKGSFAGPTFTADISGAGEMDGLNLQTADCSLDLSGASELDASIEANNLSTDLSGASEATLVLKKIRRIVGSVSGASDLTLSGTARTMELDLSGSSSLSARSLLLQGARMSLSGSSQAQINTQKELAYNLSGASILKDYGKGRITSEQATGSSRYISVPAR